MIYIYCTLLKKNTNIVHRNNENTKQIDYIGKRQENLFFWTPSCPNIKKYKKYENMFTNCKGKMDDTKVFFSMIILKKTIDTDGSLFFLCSQSIFFCMVNH